MELFIALPPKTKGNRKAIACRGPYGRRFVRANDRDRAAEQHLILAARHFRPLQPLEGPLRLGVTFVMPIPPSWTQKKRAEALAGVVLPTPRPDRGNMLKLIEDALEAAGYYRDDAAICAGPVDKVYGAEPGYRIQLDVMEGRRCA